MKYFFIVLFALVTHFVYAQQKISSIQFVSTYNAASVETGKKYPYKNDSVQIETLKFYVSGIQFYNNNELVGEVKKKYHLIDIENPSTQRIDYSAENNLHFNQLHFSIGVDSTTNESGALGDDLDPTNGMYWTWQSGYINFKLEGTTKLCPARKNQFTFHIGGYQHPYNTIQNLQLPVINDSSIVVNFDISLLLKQLSLGEVYEVMSPNEKAMMIAKKIGAAFSITQ